MNTSDPRRVCAFIERFCRLTRGRQRGQPVILREWQRDIVSGLIVRRPRRALVGLPRKSGKSALAAWVALYALCADDEGGAEVIGVASTKEQAQLVFREAKQCVKLSPELSSFLIVERHQIIHPPTDSRYITLSAEADSAEGYNPSLAIADELHTHPDTALYDALSLATAARENPLLMAITTAGARYTSLGQDSPAWLQYQYGKRLESGEAVDPDFWFRWYEPADPGCDHRDPASWAEANPGYGDFQQEKDFAAACRVTTEAEFRTKRLNQWVSNALAWLPTGTWQDRGTGRRLVPGEVVCLGFDGSFSGDSTGIVACTLDGFLSVVGLWEKPLKGGHAWRVNIDQVEARLRALCKLYRVVAIGADPYRWQRSIQALEKARLPMLEFPQSPARMVPATARFYDALCDGRLSQDQDPAFARHIGNATARVTSAGVQIAKQTGDSKAKIDLAVCAIMAYDLAGTARVRPAAGAR